MRRLLSVLAGLCVVAGVAGAQGAQQPPPTFETNIVRSWKAEHNKILDMAKDFPEDKFGSRPQADARSFVEELRHVTIGLEMSTAQLTGQPFDYNARVQADESKPATRASVVSEMEAAIAASYAAVEKNPSPRLVFWLGHQSEHYGKLVSIYRINNLVPPTTRAQQERARQRQN